jgi:nucleotide-binding universal stress UspA family protein
MSVQPTFSPRRKILVISNETARGDELHDAVLALADHAHPRAHVLVVAPALNSRLRHWLSDDAAARRAAIERVRDCVTRLAGAGIAAEGTIGDPDPLQAIEDALGTFPADSLVIATHPKGSSNWLARDLVERADERFDLPITHVVVGAPGAVRVTLAA